MIGCITVIPNYDGGFIGLDCSKGRGLILPGGKWEKNETYHEAAAREALEEVGIRLDPQKLRYLWHGPSGHGAETIAFLAPEQKDYFQPVTTREGTSRILFPHHLFLSAYKAYYKILFDVCHKQLAPYLR